MKIVAFAASSSSKSINKKLVTYAVNLLEGAEVEVLDINDYELPLFSEDKEAELGKPQLAQDFFAKIGESDGVIISFAEHNGSYTAAYKNLFDWCSRIDQKVFQQKPLILLSTSPGPGGARSVLASATDSAKYFAGDVKASLSIPSFYDNFDVETGVLKSGELKDQLMRAVQSISNQEKVA
ncbi:MAG: NAD(P)H-dependent oxidoreductase [Rickettsiales bacterium]|nr:NAD(P)H-dependent oxidoreductase [Rickettsiales bacterium]